MLRVTSAEKTIIFLAFLTVAYCIGELRTASQIAAFSIYGSVLIAQVLTGLTVLDLVLICLVDTPARVVERFGKMGNVATAETGGITLAADASVRNECGCLGSSHSAGEGQPALVHRHPVLD
jgi:hypothetical protein